MSKQITVSDDFAQKVEQIKKHKGFEDTPTTVDFIGQVFTSRYNATTKYANKGKKPPKKKASKKAAKKEA